MKYPVTRLLPKIFQLLGVMALVTACAETTPVSPSSSGKPGDFKAEANFPKFTDIPVPTKAKMDVDKSLILGAGEGWVGRMVLLTSGSSTRMFDFYRREMPRFGWTEFTAIRAATSVLTYSRADRVATVRISSETLGGAQVEFTVSYRNRPPSPPAP
ncbi:MAG: hypothetical protein V3T02_10095 [Alphaproteobacteria bacterium]